MENQQITALADDENKDNQSGGCLKGCLITFLVIIGAIVLSIITIIIIDHIPKTVASEEHSTYTVELQRTSSPGFPFGSQDGRIVLKSDSKKICKVDFVLSNDGKSMDEYNWNVKWETDKVVVTIMGEEQSDEVYILYYNGKTEKVNSDFT